MPRYPRERRLMATVVAAAAATTLVALPIAQADPAAGIFRVPVRDDSCADMTSDDMSQTDCDPDTPSWPSPTVNRSQVSQTVIAQNVDAPGAVAVASQDQDAPVTQLP